MALHRCEKETVIVLNEAENKALISTSQDWMKNKFRKMAEEDPNNVIITQEDESIMFVQVPKKYVKVRIPRKLSDEQRAAATERLLKFRNQKNKKG